jgi:hypothetical protein
MRTPLPAALLAGLLAIPLAGYAAGPRLDIPDLSALKGQAHQSVDIDIDGRLLDFARMLAGKADREARALMAGIQSVRVRSFEFDSDDAYPRGLIDAVRKQLSGPEWSNVVQVRSRGEENVDVFLCMDTVRNEPRGLAVVSTEKRQFTIINVVGTFDLDKVASLVRELRVERQDSEK